MGSLLRGGWGRTVTGAAALLVTLLLVGGWLGNSSSSDASIAVTETLADGSLAERATGPFPGWAYGVPQLLARAFRTATFGMLVTAGADLFFGGVAALVVVLVPAPETAAHCARSRPRTGLRVNVSVTLDLLAADLGVSTNTIARAYRELEASGLVTTRRRVGTIVQAPPAPAGPELQQQAVLFVRDARKAGLAEEEIVDLVRGAMGGAVT